MKTLGIIKEVATILTMLVALFQLFVSNNQRANDAATTASKVYQLSEKFDRQAQIMEAALQIDNDDP